MTAQSALVDRLLTCRSSLLAFFGLLRYLDDVDTETPAGFTPLYSLSEAVCREGLSNSTRPLIQALLARCPRELLLPTELCDLYHRVIELRRQGLPYMPSDLVWVMLNRPLPSSQSMPELRQRREAPAQCTAPSSVITLQPSAVVSAECLGTKLISSFRTRPHRASCPDLAGPALLPPLPPCRPRFPRLLTLGAFTLERGPLVVS